MQLEEAMTKIGDLREAFQEKYKGNIEQGEYDEADLTRLAEDDKYACVFLTSTMTKGDTTKAADTIDVCFKWRKAEGINSIQYDTFPEELHKRALETICYHGEDLQGCPIFYLALAKNIATTAEEITLLKTFIIYRFEEHYRKTPNQRCVVLMDMYGANMANVSLDLSRFVINCMSKYYPSYLAYIIAYEMPFFFRATWQVIRTFLSEEQRRYIKFMKGKDILTYVDEKQLYPQVVEACKK